MLKILNGKNYIQYSEKFQATLFFRASAKLLKNPELKKNIFNTVKIFRANAVFQGKSKLLKNPERWEKFQCRGYIHLGVICEIGAHCLFLGQLVIFRANFSAPPINCLPVRLCANINVSSEWWLSVVMTIDLLWLTLSNINRLVNIVRTVARKSSTGGFTFVQTDRQTDNACSFCMANEKTRRSSKSADHGSVIICLLSCNSSDTQRTDATLEN